MILMTLYEETVTFLSLTQKISVNTSRFPQKIYHSVRHYCTVFDGYAMSLSVRNGRTKFENRLIFF